MPKVEDLLLRSLKHKAIEEEKFWPRDSEQILTCHKRKSNFMNGSERSCQRHNFINETIFKILEHKWAMLHDSEQV